MYIYDTPERTNSVYFQPPFLHATQIGHLTRILPWVQYPHLHESEYEISFATAGNGLLNLPGCVLPLEQYSITIIPPNTAHCYARSPEGIDDLEYYVIRFRAAESDFPLQKQLRSLETSTVVSPQVMADIRALLDLALRRAKAESGRIDDFTQTLVLSILYMTSVEFSRRGRQIITHTPIYANDILHYLQQNIDKKVTMEDLSNKFHLSQSHIFRIFMRTYHTSPIHYLIYCRMREARTLILNNNLPAEDIARRLAYKNTWHFVRAFENFYGCPPDQYLESASEFEQ